MVRKKHILFIVENNVFTSDPRVKNEAYAAREFGYEVSVISPYDGKILENPTVIDGINVYWHPRPAEGSSRRALIIEYLNALFYETILSFRIYIKHRFDLIHAANPPDHIFLIALLFKLFGVKYLFDHHDITPENYIAKYNSKGPILSLLYLMEWLTFKTSDFVISTNESYKEIAIKRGGKDAGCVAVVRNGPDLSKIRVVPPNPRLRDGFAFLLGYVGIIAQQEGIENLLDAMDYIVKEKQRNDIGCIVVGTGPHWKHCVQRSKKMELDKYITFTGYIPCETLYEILSTVDVCVNPEFNNDFTDRSTMIKIIEYMAFGKPIVQFYTTEGEVTAQEAAVYVKENSPKLFAETIVSLLEDPERRNAMGRFARKRVEDVLSWQRQKEHLAKVYEKIFSLDVRDREAS